MTQERVIQELAGIAFSDLRTVCAWGPAGVTLERSSTLTPAHSRVVKQVVETVTKEGRTRRITLHDKVSALDKLARHLGLYQGHAPEEEWGTGLIGLKEMIEAREALKRQLDTLAQKAQENGQAAG